MTSQGALPERRAAIRTEAASQVPSPTEGLKIRQRGGQPQDGTAEHLCAACLSEPPTRLGGIVRLGARCRAVLRVARAHGIDGAEVLRNRREMWLPVVEFEGRYDISSRGRACPYAVWHAPRDYADAAQRAAGPSVDRRPK